MPSLYSSGIEDDLDRCHQPSKRRKLTPILKAQKEPCPSKGTESVKPAVSGQLKTPSMNAPKPKKTPTKSAANSSLQRVSNGLTSPWPDEPDELGDDENTAVATPPIKPPLSNHQRTVMKVQVVTGAGTAGNTTKASDQALSGKRNKKYKGWLYLKEGEDAGISNQDAFAKIAEEAAEEAAKAEVDHADSSIAFTKGKRERKPRLLDMPVGLQEKQKSPTNSSGQTKKRVYKEKPVSKKGGRNEDQMGNSSQHHLPMRSASLNEHVDGVPPDQESIAVYPQSPIKNQAAAGKRDRPSVTSMEEGTVQGSLPHPLKKLDFSPRTVASNKNLSNHVATQVPTSPSHTTALQLEAWKEGSQQELSKAAAHLKSFLSQETHRSGSDQNQSTTPIDRQVSLSHSSTPCKRLRSSAPAPSTKLCKLVKAIRYYSLGLADLARLLL